MCTHILAHVTFILCVCCGCINGTKEGGKKTEEKGKDGGRDWKEREGMRERQTEIQRQRRRERQREIVRDRETVRDRNSDIQIHRQRRIKDLLCSLITRKTQK